MRSATSLKRGAALLPAAAVLAFPITAVASRHDPHAAAALTISVGQAFGGLSGQGNPIAFGNNISTTRIPWIVMALDLKCTSGDQFTTTDGYTKVNVSKSRTFHAAFGPKTQQFPDGTSAVAQGTMQGTFNRSRVKASGTWQLKVTFIDANGATTDTCDSGTVHWRAVQ